MARDSMSFEEYAIRLGRRRMTVHFEIGYKICIR